MRKKFFTEPFQTEWLIKNYPILGAKKCCKHLNFPRYAINNKAHALGIAVSEKTKFEIRSRKSKLQFLEQREQYEELSKNIIVNSIEKAYSLGFLWGDGHIRKDSKVFYPSFGIVKKDFDKIISFFSCWGKWKIYYRKRDNVNYKNQGEKRYQDVGEARLNDPVIGAFLKNNSYCEKSQISPKSILSCIPKELQYMWWRGYSDADGCFYINKNTNGSTFSLCGTFNQDWSGCSSLLDSLDIKYSIYKRSNKAGGSKSSAIIISNKDGIVKFGNFIYKDNTNIGLFRKYEKFLSIKMIYDLKSGKISA